jgi:hypothetical protein
MRNVSHQGKITTTESKQFLKFHETDLEGYTCLPNFKKPTA